MARKQPNDRGYVLIAVASASVVLMGAVGMAVDLGRMYITKGEAQTFADSAALAAVLELDGTPEGVDRAQHAVASNPNRNAFGQSSFTGTVVEFSTASAGPWRRTLVAERATASSVCRQRLQCRSISWRSLRANRVPMWWPVRLPVRLRKRALARDFSLFLLMRTIRSHRRISVCAWAGSTRFAGLRIRESMAVVPMSARGIAPRQC